MLLRPDVLQRRQGIGGPIQANAQDRIGTGRLDDVDLNAALLRTAARLKPPTPPRWVRTVLTPLTKRLPARPWP